MVANSPLKAQFDKDKAFLLDQTQEYLKKPDGLGTVLETDRNKIEDAVKNNRFTEALQGLEILRHKKNGIKLTKIEGTAGETSILIRDGRENLNEAAVLGTEGFEMQYLNAVRAAIDIAKIEGKPELETKLKEQAVEFIQAFNKENENKSQEEISKNMQSEIHNLAGVLSKNGIKKAHNKLNIAKDFQNFNDDHCNIVTLSKADDNGQERTLIEAEVAFKGLTEEQKTEYQNRAKKAWFTKMPKWEQELVNKYIPEITTGNHVIPTQLRQIVGMKNAFEKIIASFDDKDFKILGTAKHAGTIVSLSDDKDSRKDIDKLNAHQLQEWIGKDVTAHTVTLNSGPIIGAGNDPAIVAQTKEVAEAVGAKNTNTPFNLFRILGITNNLSGVSDTLNKIAESLPPEVDELKAHIRPRSKFERLLGTNKPKGDPAEIIKNADLTPDEKEILTQAVELRKNVEQADVPLRLSFETKRPFISFDKENTNLNIPNALNNLTDKIRQSTPENTKKGTPEDKTPHLQNLPQEETVTMCASGKDRTGLSMFDRAVQAFSKLTGIAVSILDKLLNKNGHTAHMAGSIYAGGGTIGCFATKNENKAGIPKSRKYSLSAIMGKTADTNKIVGKKQDKKLDKEYEKNNKKYKKYNLKKEEVKKTIEKNIKKQNILQQNTQYESSVKEKKLVQNMQNSLTTQQPNPPTPTSGLNKSNSQPIVKSIPKVKVVGSQTNNTHTNLRKSQGSKKNQGTQI